MLSTAVDGSYATLFFYPGKGEESYPDLLALVIAVIVTIIVAMGVKNSVGLNNVLNVINLAVWIFIMIAGLFYVKGDNWSEGQFLPFGWPGVSPGRTEAHTAPKWGHPPATSSALLVVYVPYFHCTLQISTPPNPPILWPGTSNFHRRRLGSRPPRPAKPKWYTMLRSYLPPPLRIKPELFQNVVLESQTPCESIYQEMPLIARQWSKMKMQWLSETGRSGGAGSASAEGEILVLAGFQQQCSQAFVLSTS